MYDIKKEYKVGIYLRLSREDSKKDEKKYHSDSESINNQRLLLTKYLKENGFAIVDEYVDDGYSGSNFDRPGFKRMIDDIEKKKINTVVVKDLSRLGRSNIETNEYIERYFPAHKVRFIAILDNVDSELETMGNEMAPFKILINAQYNKTTSKNIRATVSGKKKDGLFLGWKAPYGYKKSPDNKYKLIVDEEAGKVVKRIFELAKKGESPYDIATILSKEKIPTPSVYANLNRGIKSSAYELWCPRTIDEMLENSTYIGNLTQGRRRKIYGIKMEIREPKENWIIVENTHEAIIDKVTFEQVQKIRRKSIRKEKKNNEYLFKKFLFCKECGHAIGICPRDNGKRAYTACTHYQKYSKFKICTPHTMNYNKLEAEILSRIKELCEEYINKKNFKDILEKEEKDNNLYEKYKRKLSILENELPKYDKYEDDIYLDYKKEIISEEQYIRAKSTLDEEKKKLVENIEKLKNDLSNENEITKDERKIIEFINHYLSFEKPTRELLSLLIDKVLIDNDKNIDIYFNFKL